MRWLYKRSKQTQRSRTVEEWTVSIEYRFRRLYITLIGINNKETARKRWHSTKVSKDRVTQMIRNGKIFVQ